MKKIAIVLFLILSSFYSFSQCEDTKIEKIGLYWSKEFVTNCTEKPNKLQVSVTKCEHSKGVYKIWSTAKWQGSYSTMSYMINFYIEDVEKNEKGEPGKVTLYFLDYTDNWYKSLIHICIDLQQTKPLELTKGTTEYIPYKEFEHKEIE